MHNLFFIFMGCFIAFLTFDARINLCSLVQSGDRIVVMSIHQPRYSIFKLFDTLTLLSQGRLIYHGQSSNSLTYFNTLGKKGLIWWWWWWWWWWGYADSALLIE